MVGKGGFERGREPWFGEKVSDDVRPGRTEQQGPLSLLGLVASTAVFTPGRRNLFHVVAATIFCKIAPNVVHPVIIKATKATQCG